MQCPSPINIQRPNGGGSKDRIVVGCGQCPVCLGNKRSDWTFRIHEEMRIAKTAYFMTLTLSDDYLTFSKETGESTLNKADIQTFHKLLRYYITEHIKGQEWPPYRFYATGEYGTKGTERPHYHIIAFNIPEKVTGFLTKIWGKGFVETSVVTPGRIHYVTKYILNTYDEYPGRQKPFALMSRRPGLGSNYFDDKAKWNIQNDYFHVINQQGQKQNMPYYYRRVFNADTISKRNEDIRKDTDKNTLIRRAEIIKAGDNPADVRQKQIENINRRNLKIKKSGTL